MDSPHDLDTLLEQLCQGDSEAAEQVFLAYEPMLRIVVRRMLPARLRMRFDSADIVQSIWSDLLRGFREAGWRFASAGHLKAFLIKATRNRYLARQRKHLDHVDHERPLETPSTASPLPSTSPGPFEQAQAKELWERILAKCPPAHRELIELKCQGCTFPEIATRTGYHASSVRRIFYDLVHRINQEKLTNDSVG